LHDRPVRDQLPAVPEQHMHAADRVFPVVVGEVPVERGVQQGAGCPAVGPDELGRMGDAERGLVGVHIGDLMLDQFAEIGRGPC